MKKLIWIGIILALAGGGTWWALTQKKGKAAGSTAPKFTTAQVEVKTLNRTIESTGEVRPENRLAVKPPIAGRIEELLVDEGQTVRSGEIIAWLSSTERASLLDIARSKGEEELRYWEEIYKATPLIAPLDGTVIVRELEPGQTATSSSTIVVIADRLIVIGQVDETDIGKITPGQQVDVQLDAYPDSSFTGHVTAIAYDSEIVSNVTMYEVDILPDTLPAFARSGMTATLTFFIEQKKDVPALPTAALQYRNGRAFVLPAGGGEEKSSPRPVQTGLSENGYTEILSGLQPGDTVLIPKIRRTEAAGGNPFLPFGSRRNSSSTQRNGRSGPPSRP